MNQQSDEYVNQRRTSKRFRIQAPAVATVRSREIWAFTREISTRAVYLCTTGEEDKLAVGESVEFRIKIPPSMSCSKPCFIKRRGRTIRIDDLLADEAGAVVEILEYDIESEHGQDLSI